LNAIILSRATPVVTERLAKVLVESAGCFGEVALMMTELADRESCVDTDGMEIFGCVENFSNRLTDEFLSVSESCFP
jgi:hypothetical protein